MQPGSGARRIVDKVTPTIRTTVSGCGDAQAQQPRGLQLGKVFCLLSPTKRRILVPPSAFQGVESVRKQLKISVTVSPALVADLDYVAGRLGVSRSAIISECLAAPAADMRAMLEQVPLNPTPEDVVRFRGASAGVVRDRLTNLQGIADDLLSGA